VPLEENGRDAGTLAWDDDRKGQSCQPPGFLLLERRLKGGKQPDADRLLVGLSVGTQSKGGAGEEWSTPPGSEGYPPWHLAPRPSRDPCLDTDGDGAEE
jgi:hypothetical protein